MDEQNPVDQPSAVRLPNLSPANFYFRMGTFGCMYMASHLVFRHVKRSPPPPSLPYNR